MRAIGFILREVSGDEIRQHEDDMEREATALGFSWYATLFADTHREGNYVRVVNSILRDDVDAVFLPRADHLGPDDIPVLVTHTDVYCVAEGHRHTIHTEDDPEPEGSPRVVSFDKLTDESCNVRSSTSTTAGPAL